MNVYFKNKLAVDITGFSYKNLIKPIFFLFDPEKVHNKTTHLGERLGTSPLVKNVVQYLFNIQNPMLVQTIAGIKFKNPLGLAAGFDYEARLTQLLPFLGFGFETIGTITNMQYGGNPRPILGRLPHSKSLMVNKGFKNLGAKVTSEKLKNLDFNFPLGISIGRTNSLELITQRQSIEDILKAFVKFEKAKLKNLYYELNISCPNLYGAITFYPPDNLKELLMEVDKLHLKKPVFIKMPIEKTDEEILEMLKVISTYSSKGVIFGNLQKDRKHPSLDPMEVNRFKAGYFSGRPTFQRSNELIKLAYQHYKERFVIIGCGGVFSGKDAYEKITLGASLVQFITGMIFEGPQLAASINLELLELLKKDGFTHISQAIGSKSRLHPWGGLR